MKLSKQHINALPARLRQQVKAKTKETQLVSPYPARNPADILFGDLVRLYGSRMSSAGDIARELVLCPSERRWRFDIAHLPSMILIEMDGFAYHKNLEAFKNDRRKQNYALGKGWVVLRVGAEDIFSHRPALLANLAKTIAIRPTVDVEIATYGKSYYQVVSCTPLL